MSGAFQFPGGAPDAIAVKISSTDPTAIAGSATQRVSVVWFQVTEISGNTPTVSVEIYDGTTSVYLRKGKAMTAKEELLFTEGFQLNKGQYLRVTASSADQVDVVGMVLLPSLNS